jgi:hypothetical protein
MAAVLAVVYGLKEVARDGLGPVAALAILAGLAVAVVFIRRQRLLVVFSLGLGPVFTLVVGAALSETSSELGGALGIAVLGVIGTAVYRGQVADGVPAGVPPEAADAARDTLGGVVAVAAGLPEQLGAAVLDAARTPPAQIGSGHPSTTTPANPGLPCSGVGRPHWPWGRRP